MEHRDREALIFGQQGRKRKYRGAFHSKIQHVEE